MPSYARSTRARPYTSDGYSARKLEYDPLLGITTRIGDLSRLILVALMFMGRVGGLTLIYATQSVRKATGCTLPMEKVTVG